MCKPFHPLAFVALQMTRFTTPRSTGAADEHKINTRINTKALGSLQEDLKTCTAHSSAGGGAQRQNARGSFHSVRASLVINTFISDAVIPVLEAAQPPPKVAAAEFIDRLTAELSCNAVSQTSQGQLLACKSWYSVPLLNTVSLRLPSAVPTHWHLQLPSAKRSAAKPSTYLAAAAVGCSCSCALKHDTTSHAKLQGSSSGALAECTAATAATAMSPTTASIAAAAARLQKGLGNRCDPSPMHLAPSSQLTRCARPGNSSSSNSSPASVS